VGFQGHDKVLIVPAGLSGIAPEAVSGIVKRGSVMAVAKTMIYVIDADGPDKDRKKYAFRTDNIAPYAQADFLVCLRMTGNTNLEQVFAVAYEQERRAEDARKHLKGMEKGNRKKDTPEIASQRAIVRAIEKGATKAGIELKEVLTRLLPQSVTVATAAAPKEELVSA
jgi:hypothetical protein